jgi:hypothetical protein
LSACCPEVCAGPAARRGRWCIFSDWSFETEGQGARPQELLRQFRAAWDRFAADEANLTEFLNAKRRRR